jgi:hypothetical protein
MSEKNLDRKTRALLALHDHGTRDGATAHKIKQSMLDEGFTLAEIREAAKEMGRG